MRRLGWRTLAPLHSAPPPPPQHRPIVPSASRGPLAALFHASPSSPSRPYPSPTLPPPLPLPFIAPARAPLWGGTAHSGRVRDGAAEPLAGILHAPVRFRSAPGMRRMPLPPAGHARRFMSGAGSAPAPECPPSTWEPPPAPPGGIRADSPPNAEALVRGAGGTMRGPRYAARGAGSAACGAVPRRGDDGDDDGRLRRRRRYAGRPYGMQHP